MRGTGYRWVVLVVGTAAQASVSAVFLGVAVLAPQLRSQFDLTVFQMGVVLAAPSIGMTPTLFLWGVLADRVGERIVLPLGLGAAAVCLAPAGFVSAYPALVALLAGVGAFGASVNAASGRAVMHWFPHSERGFALGIRQANVPIGGLVAAVALPPLAAAAGVGGAFLALAIACGVGAVASILFLHDPDHVVVGEDETALRVPDPLRNRDTWRIAGVSGLYLVAQTATMSFTVLFLHSARGLSAGGAAAALAVSQVAGGISRVVAGIWSDRLGRRIAPMRRLGLAIAGSLVLVAALVSAPTWLLVPVIVVAGGIGLSWNGLAFTAVAETAGPRTSGAAIGMQQTVLGLCGIVVPIAFAAVVSASSWRTAFLVSSVFPLVGWVLLRRLASR